MAQHQLRTLAFWLDNRLGESGAIGAVLVVGKDNMARREPVYLCSGEKWDIGLDNSLRKGWRKNGVVSYKLFHPTLKTFYLDTSEMDLLENGLRYSKKETLELPSIINKKIFNGRFPVHLPQSGTIYCGCGIQHIETGNIIHVCEDLESLEKKVVNMYKEKRKLRLHLDFKTFEREFHAHYRVVELQYRIVKVKL